MNVVKFIMEHFQDLLGAVVGLVTAAVGIALVIPGEQPEKALQGVVDFLKKFSKK